MRIFVTEIGNDTDNDRLELIVFWVPHCLVTADDKAYTTHVIGLSLNPYT